MKLETILLQVDKGIAKVTLNRPEALNAMTPQMTQEMGQTLESLGADQSVLVVVLTGAGRAFCAGADLKVGTPGTRGGGKRGAEEIRNDLRKAQRVSYLLHSIEKPTISLVNGPAVGGGMDWALACDLRIGCEKTRLMSAFIRIGLFPGTGGTWLMPRVMPVNKAAEMLFTGNFMEADEAYRLGVLNKLVKSEELEAEGMALAQRVAQGPPIAMRLAKMQLYQGLQEDFKTALEIAAACETITLTSDDHREGVAAFLEKRAAQFQGR